MATITKASPIEWPSIENMFPEEYNTLPERIKDRYVYDEKTHTYKMVEYEWHKQRAHGIDYDNPYSKDYLKFTLTGSEAATVMEGSEIGRNNMVSELDKRKAYTTYSALVMKKMGTPLPLSLPNNNTDMLMGGHIFEPAALRCLEEILKKENPMDVVKVVYNFHMYQCGEKDEKGNLIRPYALADCDGDLYINNELKGIVECKNLSGFSEDIKTVKENRIPWRYYCQGLHYMMVRNVNRVYYVFLCGNQFPQDVKVVVLDRNEREEIALIEIEDRFISSLERGEEPCMDGSDGQDVEKLYTLWKQRLGNYDPSIAPLVIEGDEELVDAAMDIMIIQDDIKELENQINELKTQISLKEVECDQIMIAKVFPKAGNANEIRIPYGSREIRIQLKKPSGSEILDIEKLKEEYPHCYEECCKKFDLKLFKRMFPAIYEKYLVKDSNILTEEKKKFLKIFVVQKKKEMEDAA